MVVVELVDVSNAELVVGVKELVSVVEVKKPTALVVVGVDDDGSVDEEVEDVMIVVAAAVDELAGWVVTGVEIGQPAGLQQHRRRDVYVTLQVDPGDAPKQALSTNVRMPGWFCEIPEE